MELYNLLQGNIANVMSTIQANKIVEDGTQAVQGLTIRWDGLFVTAIIIYCCKSVVRLRNSKLYLQSLTTELVARVQSSAIPPFFLVAQIKTTDLSNFVFQLHELYQLPFHESLSPDCDDYCFR